HGISPSAAEPIAERITRSVDSNNAGRLQAVAALGGADILVCLAASETDRNVCLTRGQALFHYNRSIESIQRTNSSSVSRSRYWAPMSGISRYITGYLPSTSLTLLSAMALAIGSLPPAMM